MGWRLFLSINRLCSTLLPKVGSPGYVHYLTGIVLDICQPFFNEGAFSGMATVPLIQSFCQPACLPVLTRRHGKT